MNCMWITLFLLFLQQIDVYRVGCAPLPNRSPVSIFTWKEVWTEKIVTVAWLYPTQQKTGTTLASARSQKECYEYVLRYLLPLFLIIVSTCLSA